MDRCGQPPGAFGFVVLEPGKLRRRPGLRLRCLPAAPHSRQPTSPRHYPDPCRPRAHTRRSGVFRPAAEKNTCAPARIVCGRWVFCYRRLSFCNGKLITAAPLPGQCKVARRIGQRGGDDLLPREATSPICFQQPGPRAHGQAPAPKRLTAAPSSASTAPAYDLQN